MTWIELLRRRVEETSYRQVAHELGYSTATIYQVLKGSYQGNLERIRRRVEAIYRVDEVPCPVLGLISTIRCAHERRRPFAATNPIRVRLFRTCPTCPYNPDRKESHG